MSTIYVIEEEIDYGDAVSSCDVIVTDEKSVISEILFNITLDEDFTSFGYKNKYSYTVIEWKGRVSKVLLSFGCGGKESAIHFIESLTQSQNKPLKRIIQVRCLQWFLVCKIKIRRILKCTKTINPLSL